MTSPVETRSTSSGSTSSDSSVNASAGLSAIASPSMDDTIAFLNGIDSVGRIVATSYWTWNGDVPATYGPAPEAHKWGSGTAGTPGGLISYYFDPAGGFTVAEKEMFSATFALWSAIADIQFILTEDVRESNVFINKGEVMLPSGGPEPAIISGIRTPIS